MEYYILDDFSFEINPKKIFDRMHLSEEEDLETITKYAEVANEIARPKAAFAICDIDKRTKDTIEVSGITFKSKLLVQNVEKAQRIFPYVMTCGEEIFEWAKTIDGFIEKYFAEEIKIEVLGMATKEFNRHMKEKYLPGKKSSMNPGSLEEWPIKEQKKLFELMKEPAKEIGVKLTDSALMLPDKSVSGILFATEHDFVNCMLCPRENCPNRRAPYERAK